MRLLTPFALFLFTITLHAQQPHQRVLVPVSLDDLPGAGGSLWTTELWAVNPSGTPVSIRPLPCLITAEGCRESIVLPPGRSVALPALGHAERPGVIISVPPDAPVFFTLHVRDRSRQDQSWGVEVPVVRSTDFFSAAASMTGIALDSRYRHTLRLYMLQSGFAEAFALRVQLYAVGGAEDVLVEDRVVTLVPPLVPPPNQIGSPLAQVVIGDLFDRDFGGAQHARLTVTPITNAPWWGFVSVTNNETQQVTTVTPH